MNITAEERQRIAALNKRLTEIIFGQEPATALLALLETTAHMIAAYRAMYPERRTELLNEFVRSFREHVEHIEREHIEHSRH
jgi:hypothetical protein